MRLSSFYENPSEFFLFVKISFFSWESFRIFFICENLFFMTICVNLFLKSLWKKGCARIPASKTSLLSSKHDNDMFQVYAFALNSSYCMSNYFLLNKVSLNSLNSVGICTLLVVLVSLPSIFLIEYILTLIQQNHYLFFFLARLSFYQ